MNGCGVPDTLIKRIPELIAEVEPIQFYSCFISYSTKDQDFANKLFADLQEKLVRCWFAPKDLRIGDRFRDKIDESIRSHDKFLLILSENSISSHWVRDEVEAALERERLENSTALFPIQIDEGALRSQQGWLAAIRRTRHVGDFRNWNDQTSYREALDGLLRDLRTMAGT